MFRTPISIIYHPNKQTNKASVTSLPPRVGLEPARCRKRSLDSILIEPPGKDDQIPDKGLVSFTMGDGSLIVPVLVYKINPTPPGLSWVSRDQKLHVKDRCISFMLIL